MSPDLQALLCIRAMAFPSRVEAWRQARLFAAKFPTRRARVLARRFYLGRRATHSNGKTVGAS